MNRSKLLTRLLRKANCDAETPPPTPESWRAFQEAVERVFSEFQERQDIAENALRVTSAEMESLYAELQRHSAIQLQSERLLLTKIIDALPVGVSCKEIANDYRYVLWNNACENIFGLPAASVVGKADFELYPANLAKATRELDASTTIGKDHSTPDEQRDANGRRYILRSHRIAIPDHTGAPKYVLITTEDVTNEHETRATLIHTAKMVSLGEMAGGIAHEINNPLGIIHGCASIIRKLIGTPTFDKNRIQTMTDDILDTCDRIDGIVKGLKAFSRRSEDDPTIKESIGEILESVRRLCRDRLSGANVDFSLELPAEPVFIMCRKVQIGQVLLNLIGNAIDAVSALPERWIKVLVTKAHDAVRIEITDSGKGIPAHIQEKIMQPFFTTKPIGQGTGLGLSISSTIIAAHSGTLRYDQASENTKFVIALPNSEKSEDQVNAVA